MRHGSVRYDRWLGYFFEQHLDPQQRRRVDDLPRKAAASVDARCDARSVRRGARVARREQPRGLDEAGAALDASRRQVTQPELDLPCADQVTRGALARERLARLIAASVRRRDHEDVRTGRTFAAVVMDRSGEPAGTMLD